MPDYAVENNNDASGMKSSTASLDDDNDAGPPPAPEGSDAEEALFSNLEQDADGADGQGQEQPKSLEAAPKLLQKALEKGEVQASDSEQESDKDHEDERKEPASPQRHVHQRVRNVCV